MVPSLTGNNLRQPAVFSHSEYYIFSQGFPYGRFLDKCFKRLLKFVMQQDTILKIACY